MSIIASGSLREVRRQRSGTEIGETMKYKKITEVYKNGVKVAEFDTREKASVFAGVSKCTVNDRVSDGKQTRNGYSFKSRDTEEPACYEQRHSKEINEVRICNNCGKEFTITSTLQLGRKYCQESCKREASRYYKKTTRQLNKIKADMAEIDKNRKEEIHSVNGRARNNGIHYGDQVAKDEHKEWPHHRLIGKVWVTY